MCHITKDFTKVTPTFNNCELLYGTLPMEDLSCVSDHQLARWVGVINRYGVAHWKDECKAYLEQTTLREQDRADQSDEEYPGFSGARPPSIIPLRPYVDSEEEKEP